MFTLLHPVEQPVEPDLYNVKEDIIPQFSELTLFLMALPDSVPPMQPKLQQPTSFMKSPKGYVASAMISVCFILWRTQPEVSCGILLILPTFSRKCHTFAHIFITACTAPLDENTPA
jgi:hypothetical protein